MLRPLLFILAIVTLIALALNFNLFSDVPTIQKTIVKSTKKVSPQVTLTKEVITIHDSNTTPTQESNLTKELQALIKKADTLFIKNRESEAVSLYDQVITRSKNSTDVDILKLFSQACLSKATLYLMYSSYDIESAKESLECIINNFQNRYNKELLLIYMRAKLQNAQITSKEQLLVAYDELIEKFQKDKEQRFEKEIEEMLFNKSFALMGVNDEEAIEVLDSLIAKYKGKKNLPETVKYSILNNIELSIITSNDTERYVDLANKYMSKEPDTKPLLEMLNIIKNAQELEQSEALEAWKKEHSDYAFPDWDFSELRKWVNGMETPESQERIRHYLDIFEKQKYKNLYQSPAPSVPVNPIYSEESTQNSYSEPDETIESTDSNGEESNEKESNTEESQEVPSSDPEEPYLDEIISTEPEITYPNPYAEYEPNEQADGVTHNYTDDY